MVALPRGAPGPFSGTRYSDIPRSPRQSFAGRLFLAPAADPPDRRELADPVVELAVRGDEGTVELVGQSQVERIVERDPVLVDQRISGQDQLIAAEGGQPQG